MKIKITPIGVSEAFTIRGFQTNYLVSINDSRLLIDCGTTAPQALDRLNISIADIENVYVSHLHLDHCGGLVPLGIQRHFSNQPLPKVYLHTKLFPKIWDSFLSTLVGQFIDRQGRPQVGTAGTFFDFIPIATSLPTNTATILIGEIPVQLVAVDHISGMPSHGLLIAEKIFVSTDTNFQPDLITKLDSEYNLKAIFHDCAFNDSDSKRFVHTTYEQLKTLPRAIREKLVLTHYEDWILERGTSPGETEMALGVAGKEYLFEF